MANCQLDGWTAGWPGASPGRPLKAHNLPGHSKSLGRVKQNAAPVNNVDGLNQRPCSLAKTAIHLVVRFDHDHVRSPLRGQLGQLDGWCCLDELVQVILAWHECTVNVTSLLLILA